MTNKRILICDDNVELVEYLEEFLSQTYDISTAHSGMKAMGEIYNQKPDMILLDLKMDEITGIDFLSMIKSDDNFKDIKIVVITAFADEELEQEMFEIGMEDILIKPFSNQDLLKKVTTVFQR